MSISDMSTVAGQKALDLVSAGTGLATVASAASKAFADYETKKTENEMDTMNNVTKASEKLGAGLNF